MWRSLGAVVLLALVTGTPPCAQTRAQFVVQATVPARVTLTAIEQPAEFVLTEEDVARGYKDLTARYRVEHNSSRGWLLQLSPRLGLTARVEVRGLAQTVVLNDEIVEVRRPGGREPDGLALDYRFMLRRDVRPGRYELPVHVSAATL